MYLLIDVRTSTPSDFSNLYYAQTWADIWLSYHKNDTIVFLAFEGDLIEKYACIFLSRKWNLFQKKLSNHEYGPDRIISFSSLPPIDTSIPIILHVSDLRMKHYEEGKGGSFTRIMQQISTKKLYSTARNIIVPWKEIGSELEELYAIKESKVSILPYMMEGSEKESLAEKRKTILTHGISDEYFITEGTPTDEWQPIELIKTYSQYIHKHGGHEELIILGDLGENFDKIVTLVRSLDILHHIKIIGILSREERDSLYKNAKGWIYIGFYYSRGASVELAHSYNIPLYLSQIPGLSEYDGTYIHPNHIDQLSHILETSQKKNTVRMKNNNQEIIQAYARIISE